MKKPIERNEFNKSAVDSPTSSLTRFRGPTKVKTIIAISDRLPMKRVNMIKK
jgi:hypothetical protein